MWEGPPDTTGGPGDLGAGETGLPTNEAWLIAVDDPDQFLANTEYRASGSATCPDGTDADDLEQPVIDLEDVKPGDFGEVTIDFALCDNPGYVWLQLTGASASENGYTEPERKDDDESGLVEFEGEETDLRVELLDVVQAAYWVDDGNNYQNGEEQPAAVGSLREVLAGLAGAGAPLRGDVPAPEGGGSGEQGCFSAGTTHSVALAWWVPVDHGNEIQTDSARFSFRLYTEQCRHNDGVLDPLDAFLNDEAAFVQPPVWDGSVVDATGQDEVEVRVGSPIPVDGAGFPPQLPNGYDPRVVRVSEGTTVRWTWEPYGSSVPPFFNQIPHDVVSLEEGLFSSGPPNPLDGRTFTHTFDFGVGTYPYYCTPHGAPFLVPSSPGVPATEIYNEFGMRGAVIVE
jgi:plastocyanin